LDEKLRIKRRRAQQKLAAELMFDLQNALQEAVAPYRAKLEQARELIAQLLSVLAQSSSENGHSLQYKQGENINGFVERIWFVVSSHQQLKATAVQLKGILPESDIKLLLAREIDLSQFMPSQASTTASLD